MKVDVRTPEGLLLGTLELPTDRVGACVKVPMADEMPKLNLPFVDCISVAWPVYEVRIESCRLPYATRRVPAIRWTGTLQQLRECYGFTEVTHDT